MNMENKRLGDICELIPGAPNSAYNKEVKNEAETVYLLKGSNLDIEGEVLTEGMNKAQLVKGKKIERYLLQQNDAVILARGSAIRAGYLPGDTSKIILATGNFLILRPHPEEIRGEVLSAYLNSVVGRQRLKELNRGAVIQHVTMADLRKFELPVPTIEQQNEMVEMINTGRAAYRATLALAEQQKRASNAFVLNLMYGVA